MTETRQGLQRHGSAPGELQNMQREASLQAAFHQPHFGGGGAAGAAPPQYGNGGGGSGGGVTVQYGGGGMHYSSGGGGSGGGGAGDALAMFMGDGGAGATAEQVRNNHAFRTPTVEFVHPKEI